jgi:polysaccharide biosynthesis transport protein
MTPSHETGFTRLVAVARRRRWTVIPIALTIAAAGVLLVWRLPPEYRARAIVRIDDPRPARDYVAPTVTEPGVERLKSRRIGFLARPLVAEAARRVGLPDDARSVESITSRLDARPEGEDAFILTYTDSDGEQARRFLAALTEVFAEQRARENSEQAGQTAAFFQEEVDALRPKVAAADAKVEKYKMDRYGSLPEQLEANLRMLDETQMEMSALVASIDTARSRRASIIADADSPIRRQEEEAARALTVARARYAADSDEVKNLAAELERVRQQRVEEESENGRRARRSLEVRQAEAEIARAQSRLDELRGRERELTQRIENAAKNGEVMARIVLDREILRDQLKTLVEKQEQAQLAAGLEAGVVGKARVAVVEPAWATLAPVAPPRMFLAAVALILGLLVGLGVGLFLEATDRRVRLVADVKRMTGTTPVLGVVPRLSSRGGR